MCRGGSNVLVCVSVCVCVYPANCHVSSLSSLMRLSHQSLRAFAFAEGVSSNCSFCFFCHVPYPVFVGVFVFLCVFFCCLTQVAAGRSIELGVMTLSRLLCSSRREFSFFPWGWVGWGGRFGCPLFSVVMRKQIRLG